jgi:hypothetical protein
MQAIASTRFIRPLVELMSFGLGRLHLAFAMVS